MSWLFYDGPWAPVIAFVIVAVLFTFAIGGALLVQGSILDLGQRRRARKRRTRIEKTRTLPGRPSRAVGRA